MAHPKRLGLRQQRLAIGLVQIGGQHHHPRGIGKAIPQLARLPGSGGQPRSEPRRIHQHQLRRGHLRHRPRQILHRTQHRKRRTQHLGVAAKQVAPAHPLGVGSEQRHPHPLEAVVGSQLGRQGGFARARGADQNQRGALLGRIHRFRPAHLLPPDGGTGREVGRQLRREPRRHPLRQQAVKRLALQLIGQRQPQLVGLVALHPADQPLQPRHRRL